MRLASAALSLMAPDAKVSFDPNIRAEWLGRGDLLRQWQPVLERARLHPAQARAKPR